MRYQYKREPLTQEEANRLANACSSHEEKLIIWSLLDTGLRVTELSKLTKDNLDWQNHPFPFKIYTTIDPNPLPKEADQTGIVALSAIGASSAPGDAEKVPALGDLAHTFRERWEDPTPLDHRNPWRLAARRLIHEPRHPRPLPPERDAPAPNGTHAVQVLRTYPAKRPRSLAYVSSRRSGITRTSFTTAM